MLLCMLSVTASAAYVPEDMVSENRDGRQLIIKTYTLPPDADPMSFTILRILPWTSRLI